jgi:hypothetical protein
VNRGKLIDQIQNRGWFDLHRLADDERGVKTVSGDEVCGLKLPVGKHAVDDLESECEPFDRIEGRRSIEPAALQGGPFGPAERLLQLEHNLRLDLRRGHPGDRQRRRVVASELDGVVVDVRPDQRLELHHPPDRFVRKADLHTLGGPSRGAPRACELRFNGVRRFQIKARISSGWRNDIGAAAFVRIRQLPGEGVDIHEAAISPRLLPPLRPCAAPQRREDQRQSPPRQRRGWHCHKNRPSMSRTARTASPPRRRR